MALSLPPATAQEDGEKAAKVEFRVTRFDTADRESPVFLAGHGERKTEVEVPLTSIAGPFEVALREGSMLDFFKEGSEVPAVSVEVKPAERQHLLLVFFHQDEDFRVLKVHSPPDRIKGGDRHIVNATPHELAIKLGKDEPLRIASGKSGILAGPPGAEIVSLPVLISLKQEDQWNLASTENWPCDPRFRKFLVAYLSPRSGHLVFHSVSEGM